MTEFPRSSDRIPWLTRLSSSPYTLSLGASAGVQVMNVITGILLARSLGPVGRGELAAVVLWPLVLASLGSLGIADAITFHAARGSTAVGTLVGTFGALGIAQATVLMLVGVGTLSLALHDYRESVVASAYLFLAIIPLNLGMLYLMGLLNGLHRYVWFNGVRLLVGFATAVPLAVLAAERRLTVRTAVIAYLGAHVVAMTIAVIGVGRSGVVSFGFDRGLARSLLGFGVRSHASNVSGLLNERLDQLVISMFLGPARLGLYVVAVTLSSATALVGASASHAALPAIAKLGPIQERLSAARRYISLTFLLSFGVTAPILLLAPTLITLLFGQEFRAASGVARVVLIATVFLSVARVTESILKAIGRPLDAGIAETVAVIATVGGLAILLPTMGLMGAGLASLMAYLSAALYAVLRAARALSVSPMTLLIPTDRWRTSTPAPTSE